jgi:hypothetical protein
VKLKEVPQPEVKLKVLIPETDLPDSDVRIRKLSPTVLRE